MRAVGISGSNSGSHFGIVAAVASVVTLAEVHCPPTLNASRITRTLGLPRYFPQVPQCGADAESHIKRDAYFGKAINRMNWGVKGRFIALTFLGVSKGDFISIVSRTSAIGCACCGCCACLGRRGRQVALPCLVEVFARVAPGCRFAYPHHLRFDAVLPEPVR